jgi:hypothetical protein
MNRPILLAAQIPEQLERNSYAVNEKGLSIGMVNRKNLAQLLSAATT